MTKAKEEQPLADDEELVELPSRYHLEGCPENDDDLEWEERPATAGNHAGFIIEIIRCVRCGGQTEKRKRRIEEVA